MQKKIVMAVAAAAAVIIAIAAWAFLRTDPVTVDVEPVSTAIAFGADGRAGSSGGGTQVDVYVDYLCPICAEFERINGDDLDDLRASGGTVVIHPVSILDRYSRGTGYSTRAASAMIFVADRSPEHALEFNRLLFENQPGEDTAGLSDTEIAEVARAAGVPPELAAQIPGNHADLVEQATKDAIANPDLYQGSKFGTPTILIDGEVVTFDWSVPGALAAQF